MLLNHSKMFFTDNEATVMEITGSTLCLKITNRLHDRIRSSDLTKQVNQKLILLGIAHVRQLFDSQTNDSYRRNSFGPEAKTDFLYGPNQVHELPDVLLTTLYRNCVWRVYEYLFSTTEKNSQRPNHVTVKITLTVLPFVSNTLNTFSRSTVCMSYMMIRIHVLWMPRVRVSMFHESNWV